MLASGRLESSLGVGGQGDFHASSGSAGDKQQTPTAVIPFWAHYLCPRWAWDLSVSWRAGVWRVPWLTQIQNSAIKHSGVPGSSSRVPGVTPGSGMDTLQKLLEIFQNLLTRTFQNRQNQIMCLLMNSMHKGARAGYHAEYFCKSLRNVTEFQNWTLVIFKKALFQSSEVLKLCVLHRTSHDEGTLVYFLVFSSLKRCYELR